MKTHSRTLRQNRTSDSSTEEAEVLSIKTIEVKKHGRRNGGEKSARRHAAEDEYHRAARSFYDPPSQNSAVVETVYRRPRVYADLHEYDEAAEIDNVPTAVGFHSMDSAEEIVAARSTANRYEWEEIKVPEPEPEPEREPEPEPEPEVEPKEEGSVSKEGQSTCDAQPFSPDEEGEPEENQTTSEDDARYEDATSDTITDKSLKSVHSDDSDSCPAMWRSESQEEEHDHDWMIAQAQRARELNSVKIPHKMLRAYEKSQIVRQVKTEEDVKAEKKSKLFQVGQGFRRLVGGTAATGKKKQSHQSSKRASHSVKREKGSK